MAQIRGYWCHMQTIARELQTLVFFKLDHMVQTLNFLGFLEHLATLMPEVRWWRNADKSSADFIRGLQSHSFADKRHLLWCGSNSCPVAQLSLDIVLTTDVSKSGWGATDQASWTVEMWTQYKNNPHKLCRDDNSRPSTLTDLGFKEAEYPNPIAAWQWVTHCIHNHKGETDSEV